MALLLDTDAIDKVELDDLAFHCAIDSAQDKEHAGDDAQAQLAAGVRAYLWAMAKLAPDKRCHYVGPCGWQKPGGR